MPATYDLAQIRERLQQALSRAVTNGDWDRFDPLSEGLRLLDQVEENETEQTVNVLIELLGREAVLGAPAAEESVPAEEVISPASLPEPAPIPEKAPPSPPTVPSSAQMPLLDFETEEGEVEDTTLSETGPRTPPSSAALRDQTPPGSGWSELRALRRQPPQTWEELAVYFGQLNRYLNELGDAVVRSEEGRRAYEERNLLQRALNRLDRVARLEKAMTEAVKRQDIEPTSRIQHEVEQIETEAQQDRELEQRLYNLYQSINAHIADTRERITQARARLAADLRTFLTVQATSNRDDLAAKLEDLKKKRAERVEKIPIDLNDSTYHGIAYEMTDLGPVANLDDVERKIRESVLDLSVKQARRLTEDCQGFLAEFKLDLAKMRFTEAWGFATTPGLEDAPDLKPLQKELEQLRHEIEIREHNAAKAQELFDAACQMEEAEAALRQIKRAEDIFPILLGLAGEKSTRAKQWQSGLALEMERVARQSRAQAESRNYEQAMQILDQERTLMARRQVLAEYAGVDLSQYIAELKDLAADIEAEARAWNIFREQRERVLAVDPPTRKGMLDEQRLRKQFPLEESLFALFGREWQALKNELSLRLGDSALYQQILERFEQDPGAEDIPELIAQIADERYRQQVEVLLLRHQAYEAWSHAEAHFRGKALSDEEKTPLIGSKLWADNVLAALAEARSSAQQTGNQELLSAITSLENDVTYLHEIFERIKDEWRRGAFGEIWRVLQTLLDSAGETGYRQEGLELLLAEIKKEWHKRVLAFLQVRIFSDLDHPDRSIRSTITLKDVSLANRFLADLERHEVLDFDNAGLLQERLWRLQQEATVGALLSRDQHILPVWTQNSNELMELIKRRSQQGIRADQWEQLLSTLEALRTRSTQDTGISSAMANELWFFALIYYAVQGPTQQVIDLIQRERQKDQWLAINPFLCGLLAMRYANPQQEAETAPISAPDTRLQALQASLATGYGRVKSDLVDTLQLLSQAQMLWRQGQYETAEELLDSFVQSLLALARKEGETRKDYAQALHEAKDWLLRDWRSAVCQKLQTEIAEMDVDPGLDVFDVLRKMELARKMCGPDPVLEQRANQMKQQAVGRYDDLAESVDQLLRRPVADLEAAIREGSTLLEKLKVALAMDLAKAPPERMMKRLRQDAIELSATLTEWRKTRKLLESVRLELEDIFGRSQWTWSVAPELSPNKELADLRRKLDGQKKSLRQSSPPELEKWLDIVRRLEDACFDIGRVYDEIKGAFEGDAIEEEGDFDMLQSRVRELREKTNNLQASVRQRLREMNENGIRLEFKSGHIQIYDDRRPAKSRSDQETLPTTPVITNLWDLEQAINTQRSNWQEWRAWMRTVISSLQARQRAEKDSRRHLRGELSKARQEVAELTQQIEIIASMLARTPKTLLSQAALNEARNTYGYEPMDDLVLADLWQLIEEGRRDKVRGYWLEFLDKELQQARQSAQEIQANIAEKEKVLAKLKEKMKQHVEKTPDRRATWRSQEIYLDFLSQAERIDRSDPAVKRYRQRYDRRQSQLERRR